jgi:hypothetical protein
MNQERNARATVDVPQLSLSYVHVSECVGIFENKRVCELCACMCVSCHNRNESAHTYMRIMCIYIHIPHIHIHIIRMHAYIIHAAPRVGTSIHEHAHLHKREQAYKHTSMRVYEYAQVNDCSGLV